MIRKHPGLGFYRRIMDIVVWEGLKLRAKQQTFIRQNLPEINDHTVNFQNPYHPCMENLPTRGKCRKIYHTYIHGAYEYTKHMGVFFKHATPHDTMTLIMPQGSQTRFPTHWKAPTAPIDWTMDWDMKQRLKFDSSKHRQVPTKKTTAISQAYHTNLQSWRSWLPRFNVEYC